MGAPLDFTANDGSAAIPHVPWGGPPRFIRMYPLSPKLDPHEFFTIHASAVYPTIRTAWSSDWLEAPQLGAPANTPLL